jgi:hypothetical protein
MSAPSEAIVDIEGEAATPPGHDRRRGVALVFAFCLTVGSAFFGRDDHAAIPEVAGPDGVEASTVELSQTMVYSRSGAVVTFAPAVEYLSLPPNTTDVLLSVTPGRFASEALPPLQFAPVRVRAVSGFAFAEPRPGGYRMITWTELGDAYWLVSDRRDIADLVRLADTLR